MKGDFSRFTFKKIKHFAAVLSQQGRVLLDAEQNEAEAIETYLRETSLTDIIGQSGVPLDSEDAFQITSVTTSDFMIQPGHMYVDGILVENDAQVRFTGQPYIKAEGEEVNPPSGGDTTRVDLVYLEVWQQHVTALEDPDIREPALNIPDTTTRLRTLWRVHVLSDIGDVTCDDPVSGFPPPASTIRLTNDVSLTSQAEDPCVIAPDGGFRLLENRLLRVEVHKGSDAAGGPTVKWSAENAAVAYAITAVSPITITVGGNPQAGLRLTLKQQARDQFLSLGINDLVEIVSGEDEIRGNPGVLGTVHERISATVYDVLLNPSETVPAAYTATPLPSSLYDDSRTDFKVRRWDGLITDLTATTDLGNTGVNVSFSPNGASAHTGDYWMFAGRTANIASAADSIEKLTDAPPRGVKRHYARLALVQWNGAIPDPTDCRDKFPPLTDMVELLYVSGDGQEARPGESVSPLIVRVSNGGIPVANAAVTFVPAANSGTVTAVPPATGPLPARTDANGLASVDWTLGPAVLGTDGKTTNYRQQVTASLEGTDQQIIFNADLSIAAEVAYAPKDPTCFDPPVDNVKDALDQLCARGTPEDPGIHIVKVSWADGKPADNNSQVGLSELLNGLIVSTDRPVASDSVNRATCYMIIEMPMVPGDPTSWFYPIVIRAEQTASGNEVHWKPGVPLPVAISDMLAKLNGPDWGKGLLARFYLKGNFIRDDKSELYLDGEDYGVANGAAPFNLLPLGGGFVSGDKRRGGDFYMWFTVVPDINIHALERAGFVVRRTGSAQEFFGTNLDALLADYVSILDRAIDRPHLDASLFPTNYEPLPEPFDLAGAQTDWKAQILAQAGGLSKGSILVFSPQSMEHLNRVLCDMWTKIDPNVTYKPMAISDDAFVANLMTVMTRDQEAGQGLSMVILGSASTLEAVVTAHPADFNVQQYKPI